MRAQVSIGTRTYPVCAGIGDCKTLSMIDLIYSISPQETPILFRREKASRRLLVKQHGQSVRALRRRLSKPLKFSPKMKIIHEWRRD